MGRYGVDPRELDLRLHATIVSEKMNIVPGFRTSAAFFTFLRANLALPPSESLSALSTPLLEPISCHHLPPLGTSSLSTMTSIDSCDSYSTTSSSPHSPSSSLSSADSIRSFPSSATSYSSESGWSLRGDGDVSTEVLWLAKDKQSAIDLVKESIKEQKINAFLSVISHPLIVMWWLLLASILWKVGKHTGSDLPAIMTAVLAITAACVASLWRFTGKYDRHVETIDSSSWLTESDIIVGAFLGDELVGTAILRVERSASKENKRRKVGGKGVVRAWTTSKLHRKKGVGKALLEEVVRVTRDKMRNSTEIGFSSDHANGKVFLPELFNRGFRLGERRAARTLEGIVGGNGVGARRPGRRRGR